MNGSFDPFRLVGTYGAFGSVSTDRDELVVSSAQSLDGPWKEYEFRVKPGDPRRCPPFLSPYHHRLDWQMWIASVAGLERSLPWMLEFLRKLLQRDRAVLQLLARDPWEGSSDPPKYVRVERYRYRFHRALPDEADPPYWDREWIRRAYPRQGVATLATVSAELAGGAMGLHGD